MAGFSALWERVMDVRPVGNVVQTVLAPAERGVGVSQPVADTKAVANSVQIAAPTTVQHAEPIPTHAQLTQAVQNINKMLQEQSNDLEFSIDADSNRTIIKVVDQKTKEVLRQIPSQEVLEIAKALDTWQHGLQLTQKA
jgi:flagellar protein FlaG